MEFEFNDQILKFRKDGEYNLISNTTLGSYKEIEIDININKFTKTIDNGMIINILNYVHVEIEILQEMFKPLLGSLYLKFNEHCRESIPLNEIEFEFTGVWIKSMHIFNSQFELIFNLNGKENHPNIDVTGKWTINFSGSVNNWIISGVNRIG